MLIDTTFEEMVADFGTTGEFKQIEDIMSLITKKLDTLIWCSLGIRLSHMSKSTNTT